MKGISRNNFNLVIAREVYPRRETQNDKIGIIRDELLFPVSLNDDADAPRVPLGADLGDADAYPRSMKFLEYDLRHMLGQVFHQAVVLLDEGGADAFDHQGVIDRIGDLTAGEHAIVGQRDVQIQFDRLRNGLLALVDADARVQPYFAQKYDV